MGKKHNPIAVVAIGEICYPPPPFSHPERSRPAPERGRPALERGRPALERGRPALERGRPARCFPQGGRDARAPIIRRPMSRSLLRTLLLVLAAVMLTNTLSPAWADGDLDAIRSDVRTPQPAAPASPQPSAPDERRPTEDHSDHSPDSEKVEGSLILGGLVLGAVVVAAPLWLPRAIMNDNGDEAFFPRKPWVVSAAIDWGTLGHAGLFRFQTTAGLIFDRFESYIGYEYLDIGATQANFLLGGLRVWF
jgi:hypothetical protein